MVCSSSLITRRFLVQVQVGPLKILNVKIMFNIIVAIAGLLYAIFGTLPGDYMTAFVIGVLSGYVLFDGVKQLQDK